jgi:hypothetical protein
MRLAFPLAWSAHGLAGLLALSASWPRAGDAFVITFFYDGIYSGQRAGPHVEILARDGCPLSPLFHAGGYFAHRHDFDIPAVTGANQSFQNVFEHGKPVS